MGPSTSHLLDTDGGKPIVLCQIHAPTRNYGYTFTIKATGVTNQPVVPKSLGGSSFFIPIHAEYDDHGKYDVMVTIESHLGTRKLAPMIFEMGQTGNVQLLGILVIEDMFIGMPYEEPPEAEESVASILMLEDQIPA